MKIFNVLGNYINDRTFSMVYKNSKLDVINFDKIIDFSSEFIKLKRDNEIYNIKGNNLVISKMLDNEILIAGEIKTIDFE